jgi:hypothetical protein
LHDLGFHPAATAATDAAARATRDELAEAAAANPAEGRRAFGELLEAPPSTERSEALQAAVWRSAWEEMRLVSKAVVDATPRCLFNLAHFEVRGSGSGIRLEQDCVVLYRFEAEWMVHQTYWWDMEAGARAAGFDSIEDAFGRPPAARR